MRKRWAHVLATLTLSLGIGSAWGQVPPPPPGPLPTPAPVPMVDPSGKGDIHQSAPGMPAPAPSVVIPNGGGCNDGCGPKATWSITGGLYYLKPVWSNSANQAFNTFVTSGTAPNLTTTANTTNFNYGYDVGFSGALGFTMANGVGFRFGAFSFSTEDTATATFGVPTSVGLPAGFSGTFLAGAGVSATSELDIRVYDLEATYSTGDNGWRMIYSAGARYVDLKQSYSFAGTDVAGVVTDTATSSNRFRGIGPTLSLEAHRQCGCSPFGVYGTARGSILFGTRDQSATIFGPSITGGTTFIASQSANDVLPIGELEIGGEWGKSFGRVRVFGQLGFVGQAWVGAGNAAPVLSNTSASNSNLGLFGGVFRLGVTF